MKDYERGSEYQLLGTGERRGQAGANRVKEPFSAGKAENDLS